MELGMIRYILYLRDDKVFIQILEVQFEKINTSYFDLVAKLLNHNKTRTRLLFSIVNTTGGYTWTISDIVSNRIIEILNRNSS